MVAIRRPNRVLEGKRSIDAVLDISVPFSLVAELFRSGSGNNLCIPDASGNRFVCIAAINVLHRSKSLTGTACRVFQAEIGRWKPANLVCGVQAGDFRRVLTVW